MEYMDKTITTGQYVTENLSVEVLVKYLRFIADDLSERGLEIDAHIIREAIRRLAK
jgi:hypothetical protein